MTQWHAESLLDMGRYLGPEAEKESAPRVCLQIPANVGYCHWITSECPLRYSSELDLRGVLAMTAAGLLNSIMIPFCRWCWPPKPALGDVGVGVGLLAHIGECFRSPDERIRLAAVS
jgi:hypothetical protein